MSKNNPINKTLTRDKKYEQLQLKYKDAPNKDKHKINALLFLYKTGKIYTSRGVEKEIHNATKPMKNPKLQEQKYLKRVDTLISRVEKPKPWQMRSERIKKGQQERAEEVLSIVEKKVIIKKVRLENPERAYSIIHFDLRTEPAFAGLPDVEKGERVGLEEDPTQNGYALPHKDIDVDRVVKLAYPRIMRYAKKALAARQAMKIQLGIDFQVFRINFSGEESDLPYTYQQDNFSKSSHAIEVNKANIEEKLWSEALHLKSIVDEAFNLLAGSDWRIRRIKSISLKVYKIKPPRGSSYIPTPERYCNARCGLINIQNQNDNECFKWCCKYHQTKKDKNDHRLTVLAKVNDKFNYEGVSFPASYDDIKTFEANNKVAVFVYALNEEGKAIKEKDGCKQFARDDVMYLLRIDNENNSHYIYIKNIGRFLNITSTGHKENQKDKKFCPYCSKLYELNKFEQHVKYCYSDNFEDLVANLPDAGSVMKFKNHKNKLERPFVVYADCESTLLRESHNVLLHKHVANSCCYYFVCTYDSRKNKLMTFVGPDCVYKMILSLMDLAKKCVKILQKNTSMHMTAEDAEAFKNAKVCHICNEALDDNSKQLCRVRDHDHLTGKYRGAAHACCNINYFTNRYLPVFFHNLKGYDSHLLLKEAWKITQEKGEDKIGVIPNSTEKFMCFTIGSLKFLDTFQFMASSLDKLVKNLHEKGSDKYVNFACMKKEFPLEYELLCKKGHYPYEWVDSDEKLKFEGLPERRHFYSKLSQKGLTEEEYQHARNVYEVTNCKTFLDYHLTYLKTDVVLLADVFENFRKTCMTYYSLDPANYITTPSFAWDAMLMMTKVKLELISDYKIYRMIEEQKRGGLCFVGSSRYAKANNRYLKDYNPKEAESYLMYWDMNSLYGSAMVMPLPTGGHAFVEGMSLQQILETPDDAPTGYVVRVDLKFPKEKHEYFRQYPPAPENISPKEEWLTEFQKGLAKKLNIKTKDAHPKLIPHLYDRKGYVIDYRSLKYLVGLGVEATVLEVLKYEQSDWLKKFIDFNTKKRREAKNEFEKDFFKLMSNAPYGKTMENTRNRMNLHLTADDTNAVKWFSKPSFKNNTEAFGLYMIETYKDEVKLDKPIYVGTAILDLSKLLMMRFHYDVIDKHFSGAYQLLYSDTDSLIYHIFTGDIYEWVKDNRDHFDLSESIREDMKDTENEKTLGKMKDELKTIPMKSFIGLNPKCYSFCYNKKNLEQNTKKCKGVSKETLKNEIKHSNYLNTLITGQTLTKQIVSIRSFNHQLYTIQQDKICLNSYYDKMQMLNKFDCVPFGYSPPEV